MAFIYSTPTEVAKCLGYDFEDPHIIEQIQIILDYVEPQIENYCHAVIAPSTGVKIFNGTGNKVLQSSCFIRTITAAAYLDYNGVEISDIPLTSIVLGPVNAKHGVYRYIERKQTYNSLSASGQFGDSGIWPRGDQNVKLTGTWGFATIPGPVKAAVAMTVKTMFDARDYNEFLKFESNLSRSLQFRDVIDIIPAPARKLLNYYRIMPIAFPES